MIDILIQALLIKINDNYVFMVRMTRKIEMT